MQSKFGCITGNLTQCFGSQHFRVFICITVGTFFRLMNIVVDKFSQCGEKKALNSVAMHPDKA